jgi:hypothetical protein
MHCMIAWGRPAPDAPLGASEHASVEAVLKQYDFVRAFPGAGVATVADNPQRLQIETALTNLSKEHFQSGLVFLISPPIGPNGFLYRGFLSQGLWEPINAKTKA